MAHQEIMHDVAAAKLQRVIQDFEADDAKVTSTPQPDGRFTVTAIFPRPLSPVAEFSTERDEQPVPETVRRTLPPLSKSTRFKQLANEYLAYFDICTIRPERMETVGAAVARIVEHRQRYRDLADRLAIPWAFIGVIHSLESGCDFDGHLHNGDPLSARTVHVPIGHPKTGAPPFSWEQSAMDALTLGGFVGQTDWSTSSMLFRWEAWNGFGYRDKGVATPYLWSFSQLYEKGRFVADHVFDPNSVSRQCGAAVLLKALHERSL